MIYAPDQWIDPIALTLGPLSIRWYGISYMVGIILARFWMLRNLRQLKPPFTAEQLDRFIFNWSVVGIVIGGRLGFCFFYQPMYYLQHPIEIFYITDGGMSFHGGLLGVILAAVLFTKREKLKLWNLFDLCALASPLGLFLGRLANFVNAEHFGHPTDQTWGVLFPGGGGVLRHPSQLYEAFLEGVLLFTLLNLVNTRTQLLKKSPGALSGVFMIGYGLARATGEIFRMPEAFLETFSFGLTYGQALSVLQILIGVGVYRHFAR